MNNLDRLNATAGRFHPLERECERGGDEDSSKDDMLSDMNIMTRHIDRYYENLDYDKVLEAINNLNDALGGVLE